VCASNDANGRAWIGLARLGEVFASSDNVVALAFRQTAWTKLCANFNPSQIARRMPVHAQFILQFWGPSDGLWPLKQNFVTVPRPDILDIQLKPISHSFCNCEIFTANEYFTYPYKHHGGNQRLTGNADPSPEERYILTAIFFINVLNFTAYQYAMVTLHTNTYSEKPGFNHSIQMGDITQDLRSFHNYPCFLHNCEISPYRNIQIFLFAHTVHLYTSHDTTINSDHIPQH